MSVDLVKNFDIQKFNDSVNDVLSARRKELEAVEKANTENLYNVAYERSPFSLSPGEFGSIWSQAMIYFLTGQFLSEHIQVPTIYSWMLVFTLAILMIPILLVILVKA